MIHDTYHGLTTLNNSIHNQQYIKWPLLDYKLDLFSKRRLNLQWRSSINIWYWKLVNVAEYYFFLKFEQRPIIYVNRNKNQQC